VTLSFITPQQKQCKHAHCSLRFKAVPQGKFVLSVHELGMKGFKIWGEYKRIQGDFQIFRKLPAGHALLLALHTMNYYFYLILILRENIRCKTSSLHYTVHYTALCILHCTQHCTVYCTVRYTVHYTALYTELYCILHCTVHYTVLYTALYTTLYTTLLSVHYTVYNTVLYTTL